MAAVWERPRRDAGRSRGAKIFAAAALAAFPLAAGQALAAQGDTTFVSQASDGTAGDAGSFGPSISADGRYVAFDSEANSFAVGEDEGVDNVFVRDLVSGTTTYVSRASDGTAGDDDSFRASISADGRYVAFESDANSLAVGENEGVTDIFVRDLVSGTTTYVSRASDGTAGDDSSSRASISADGRYVAFESDANSLAVGENEGVENVFVRDLLASTTTLVSRTSDGTAGDGLSREASISADGRHVAFLSGADNLSVVDDNAPFNIFVRDLVAGTTTYVSRATDGTPGESDSSRPSISADGRYVAFESTANNLVVGEDEDWGNVFVRDLLAGTTTFVSRASDGTAGDGDSFNASISADGRHVAFESQATTLAVGDDKTINDIFVRDLLAGTTTHVSRASDGTAADESSAAASISADGRYVAFDSAANTLAIGENQAVRNVFVHTLLSAPPVNHGVPKLTGQPVSGQTLSCSDGLWTEGAFTRQWRRNEQPIAGATGPEYTTGAPDVGALVDCVVTATNADGAASASSNAALISEPLQGPPGDTGPQGPAGEPAIKLLALLASDRFAARTGARLPVRFATSDGGDVRVQIKRGDRTLVSKTDDVSADGVHKLTLRLRRAKPIPPGRYTVALTITGDDGQVAKDSARLRVRR